MCCFLLAYVLTLRVASILDSRLDISQNAFFFASSAVCIVEFNQPTLSSHYILEPRGTAIARSLGCRCSGDMKCRRLGSKQTSYKCSDVHLADRTSLRNGPMK